MADFAKCVRCNSQIDLHHGIHRQSLELNGYICANCDRVYDVTRNPLPEHMQAEVEPYIRFREDQAVAKFILEQAERLNGKEKTAA